MKTLKLILLIMIVSLFSNVLPAQVSVNFNIGVPAPRYYYLQDIEAYYDIPASMYIYLSGSRWIRSRSLPESYGHYDINNGHRVIIKDYRGYRPYNYFPTHRVSFPKNQYNPERNYWSVKEHKNQFKNNANAGKVYKNEIKKQNKEFKNANKFNNKNNGNNGNGRGNGKGGGNGHGKGNKK